MRRDLQLNKLLWGVVGAWLLTFVVVYFAFDKWDHRGQFGDLFGSLNVLFSGFAFAALYFTISLQQKQLAKQDEQLRIQREELALQREEMAASRKELARQATAQQALTHATIAQIRVAAVNAAIESYKIKADTGQRSDAMRSIDQAAQTLADLATKLEQRSTEA